MFKVKRFLFLQASVASYIVSGAVLLGLGIVFSTYEPHAQIINPGIFNPSPTIITPNITGATAGANAAVGSVGEFFTNNTGFGGLTSTVCRQVATITLTAGDFDIYGLAYFNPAATTTTSAATVQIETTSAACALGVGNIGLAVNNPSQGGGGVAVGDFTLRAGPVRSNLAAGQAFFLNSNSTFAVSTSQQTGTITARRVR